MGYSALTSKVDPLFHVTVEVNMSKKGYAKAYKEMTIILEKMREQYDRRVVTRSMIR